MAVRARSSTDPGRLEPFILISLILHGVLLTLVARFMPVHRPVLLMGEGAVVEVVPVPAGGPPAVGVQPASRSTGGPQAERAASRPNEPATTAVAEKPSKPAQPTMKDVAPRPTSRPARPESPPVRPAASASNAPHELLTSERGPTVAVAARSRPGPTERAQPQPADDREASPPEQGAPTGSAGKAGGGTPGGSPAAGSLQPDPVTAVVVGASGPYYPKDAVTYGVEGRVVVAVTVGAQGKVEEVVVEESSGSPSLDRIARRWVEERWQFRPSSTGRAYRVSVVFEFAIVEDEQGRPQPVVRYRIPEERVRLLS